MTKTLKTLIKQHKQYLDEKRRELVLLEEKREEYQNFIRRLERELEAEKTFVTKTPERAHTFTLYLQEVRRKQTEANQKIRGLDDEIDALSEQISLAYSDLKKYDILKDIKEERQLQEEMRRLQVNLDEIGGVAHQRKEEPA